jgi:hypothetical protein
MKTPLTLTFCWFPLALAGCAGVGFNGPARTAAAGGTAPPAASVSFLETDTNGDARITPDEYSVHFRGGAQPESFEAADTNRDGVLTLDEWQGLVGPRRR